MGSPPLSDLPSDPPILNPDSVCAPRVRVPGGKLTLTPADVAFVEDISELLGLERGLSAQLFERFRREHPLGQATKGKWTPRDLAAVAQMYADHRSFLIRVLQTILRIDCLGRGDAYHSVVGGFVESLLERGLFTTVLTALEACRRSAPPTVRQLNLFADTKQYGPMDAFVQLHVGKWAVQCVHEQVRGWAVWTSCTSLRSCGICSHARVTCVFDKGWPCMYARACVWCVHQTLLVVALFLLFWERVKCDLATCTKLTGWFLVRGYFPPLAALRQRR